MVCVFNEELKVGQRYEFEVSDHKGIYKLMPLVVLRIATRKEYEDTWEPGNAPLEDRPGYDYFYDISLD